MNLEDNPLLDLVEFANLVLMAALAGTISVLVATVNMLADAQREP